MRQLDATTAEAYLRQRGAIAPGERVAIERLTGGVSNEVLYAARRDRAEEDFVLKQARGQLRVAQEWFCGVERIWREVDFLRACQTLLDDADRASSTGEQEPPSNERRVTVPRVLFDDRENYAYAMTAAPRTHRVWKQDLLAAKFDLEITSACARLLARLHAGSWRNAEMAERFGDQRIFDELRLDPYYRSVAARFPADAPRLNALVESVCDHRRSLVHADFSPKNLLVWDDGLMLVDFETGHFGDPAFDLGFMLSHLILKAFHHAEIRPPRFDLSERFMEVYRRSANETMGNELADVERRAALNFAGCAWARLDGKSPVEYLTDEAIRQAVRELCRSLLHEPAADWSQVVERATTLLERAA